MLSKPLAAAACLLGPSLAALVPVSSFGSNPTNIQMAVYVPSKLAAKPAVILAVSESFLLSHVHDPHADIFRLSSILVVALAASTRVRLDTTAMRIKKDSLSSIRQRLMITTYVPHRNIYLPRMLNPRLTPNSLLSAGTSQAPSPSNTMAAVIPRASPA